MKGFTADMIGKRVRVYHVDAFDRESITIGTLTWFHSEVGTSFGIAETDREFGIPQLIHDLSITTLPADETEVKSDSDTEPLSKTTNKLREALVGSIVRITRGSCTSVFVKTGLGKWTESFSTRSWCSEEVAEIYAEATKGEFLPITED